MENDFGIVDIITAIACILVIALLYIFYKVHDTKASDASKNSIEYPPRKKRKK